MRKTVLAILTLAVSMSLFAQEKDWGYVTGSLESNNNVYVEDEANNFFPSYQPQLKNDNIFASNDYLKVDYYKGRLSAGLQMEGYFPTLVGYPISENNMTLSNLYVTWKDKSYSSSAVDFFSEAGKTGCSD